MNKQEINNKTEKFFSENNITQITKDPTIKYQKQINKFINNAKYIIQKENIKYLKQIKPNPPKLNALPKIHKPNIPIRPLINNTQAPSHKIAKHLDKLIRKHINLTNNTSVKNNIELVKKLEHIHILHNSTLASFDITNLYTNVPVKDTIQTLEQLLRQNNTPETHIQEIITLTKIITEQNYFTYNNKIYTQTDGLPMGFPIFWYTS